MNSPLWLTFTVVGGFALVLGLAGCEEQTPRAQRDLPEDSVEVDDQPRTVYLMPDMFPNVVAFCDGPSRVYATTREGQDLVVVTPHDSCDSEPG